MKESDAGQGGLQPGMGIRAREPGVGRRLSVDRDALLHRYTVAPARAWLAGPLTCDYGPGGGVVSKHAHGSDGGCDTGCDRANAISHPAVATRRRGCELRSYRV